MQERADNFRKELAELLDKHSAMLMLDDGFIDDTCLPLVFLSFTMDEDTEDTSSQEWEYPILEARAPQLINSFVLLNSVGKGGEKC